MIYSVVPSRVESIVRFFTHIFALTILYMSLILCKFQGLAFFVLVSLGFHLY